MLPITIMKIAFITTSNRFHILIQWEKLHQILLFLPFKIDLIHLCFYNEKACEGIPHHLVFISFISADNHLQVHAEICLVHNMGTLLAGKIKEGLGMGGDYLQ